jgi:dihydropyrimidinase
MLSNSDLMDVFDHCKILGCVVHVHAENGEIVAENEKRLLARGVTGPGDNFFFYL